MNAIIANKYTETENNGVKSISIDDTIFIGTNLLTSAIGNAYKVIKGEKGAEKFSFDGERELIRFSGNYFIVRYSNKVLRDTDKNILSKKGDFDKFGKAKKDSNGYQIPKTDFIVDYDGNYYLMIKGTISLDEELIDINKGIFKSMIIDMNKFNSIGSEVSNTNEKIEDILK